LRRHHALGCLLFAIYRLPLKRRTHVHTIILIVNRWRRPRRSIRESEALRQTAMATRLPGSQRRRRVRVVFSQWVYNTKTTISVHYSDYDVRIVVLSIERERHRRRQRMHRKSRAGGGRATPASILRWPQHSSESHTIFKAAQVILCH
jgi:hypothetical protein